MAHGEKNLILCPALTNRVVSGTPWMFGVKLCYNKFHTYFKVISIKVQLTPKIFFRLIKSP